jgi:ABC-type branched-subunit amino acid transport system substrate-binding protein
MVATVAVATFLTACGGSSGKSSHASTTARSGAQVPGLGVGVTPTEIKLGIALIDFNCVKDYVDSIRIGQDKVYQAFVDDINAKGGINGRKVVSVYDTYCPIGTAGVLSVCTKLTEDDKVFAITGNFFDSSGDGQVCVAKQHQRVLVSFNLTQAIIDKAPPGLIIYPGATNERTTRVILDLLRTQRTLAGKKVAALGATQEAGVVNGTVLPGLRKLGVQLGTTGILSVSGTDTSAALTQLDSFIERWKGEGVNAVFLSGNEVSSSQFVTKLRGAMPKVILVVDNTDVKTAGQDAVKAHIKPNPYEGIISAGGPTPVEYDASPNWKYCAAIYEKYTHKHAPNSQEIIPGPNGKTLETNANINDACQTITMFRDIATRVGPNLNNANWQTTVDHFGRIDNRGSGLFSSLHKGKYDAEDNFRLETFDSSSGARGDWRALTPVQNVPGG